LTLRPGLHEVRPEHYLDTPAALSFQLGLLARALQVDEISRPILWVRPRADRAHDFGRPYPLALIRLGIPPDRVLLVEASEMSDVLWAMEEGLTAGALVFGEVGRSARYDLTASRRLQMSARNRQAIALVQRSHGDIQPSAALTRWRVAATQSPPMPWKGANGLPGLGPPRYRAALERVRGGPPGNFEIEWKNATLHVLQPAPMAHRAAHTAPRQPQRRIG
jgi:protein ImuA